MVDRCYWQSWVIEMKIRNKLPRMVIVGLLIWAVLVSAVTLNEAVAQVRAEHDVRRVLVAETQDVDGRRVHQIRILTNDGRVRNIRVNAGQGPRHPRPRRSRR